MCLILKVNTFLIEKGNFSYFYFLYYNAQYISQDYMCYKEPAIEHTGDTFPLMTLTSVSDIAPILDLSLHQFFAPDLLDPLPGIMLTTKYTSICICKPISNLVCILQLPQMLLPDHSHLLPLSLYTANKEQIFTKSFNVEKTI